MKKYYTTKYALTRGIEVVLTDRYLAASLEEYVFDQFHTSYRVGKTAFEMKAEAIAAAEKQRARKVTNLQKQIAKLQKMKFQ